MPRKSPDIHAILREQFDLDTFKPGQEQVIRDLLAGRDVLAVLPTGAASPWSTNSSRNCSKASPSSSRRCWPS